jgi:hypothetical protein
MINILMFIYILTFKIVFSLTSFFDKILLIDSNIHVVLNCREGIEQSFLYALLTYCDVHRVCNLLLHFYYLPLLLK